MGQYSVTVCILLLDRSWKWHHFCLKHPFNFALCWDVIFDCFVIHIIINITIVIIIIIIIIIITIIIIIIKTAINRSIVSK